MFDILLCEDDPYIRRLAAQYLERERYSVHLAERGEEALRILDSAHIDLMITDVMMPGIDGVALCKTLRDAGYELPILMMTAKETTDDKRVGFESGADDYMVKPVDMDEMLIRVAALLRRAKINSGKQLVIGATTLDFLTYSVAWGDQNLTLPKKEFEVLFLLCSSQGRILTRMQIMDQIWGYDTESDERTVDVHIKRLREKLVDNPDLEIITMKGLGYKMRR